MVSTSFQWWVTSTAADENRKLERITERLPSLGRILITGTGGFIGGALVGAFRAAGVEPYEIRNRRDLDLRHAPAVSHRVAEVRPQVIIHLAASPDHPEGQPNGFVDAHNTIAGALNLVNAVPDDQPCTFVHAGTFKQYGDVAVPFIESGPTAPISLYGRSKHLAESIVRLRRADSKRFRAICVRLGSVFGPGQGPGQLVPHCIDRIGTGRARDLVLRNVLWDPIFITDVIVGMWQCLLHLPPSTLVINLGGGVAYRVPDVAALIANVLDGSLSTVDCYDEPVGHQCLGDVRLARQVLGWAPAVSLRRGIEITIDHFGATGTRPVSWQREP